MQSGIGRTGPVWAVEHYGVEPDLVVSGKSLGGGLPLAGVTGPAELMDAVEPGGLGGTFGGNPVACAAALAVLDEVASDKWRARADELADLVRSRLLEIQGRSDHCGDVRGLGAMQAVELVRDSESKEPAPDLAKATTTAAREHGLLLLSCGTYGNVIRILVPARHLRRGSLSGSGHPGARPWRRRRLTSPCSRYASRTVTLRPSTESTSRSSPVSSSRCWGRPGSGKTTTLRLIAGFEQPDEGRVLLSGTDVTAQPPYERDVNTVFQDYALFPHMSVAENVGYGLRVKGVRRGIRRKRVEEALEVVRLAGLGPRRPSQLSGGQRQRVALARAIVNEPQVLLLDEPLGALDLKLRQEMQIELQRIQREVGITFIYVTHDQEEALTMSDRLAVFNEGRIEQVGSPGRGLRAAAEQSSWPAS